MSEETSGQYSKQSRVREYKSYRRDRTSVFAVGPRVLVDNGGSATYTGIEVNARDRVGLL